MRILVTGATGFNGGYVARELKREGHQVRVLVRRESNFGALEQQGMEPFVGELVNPSDVDAAVRGCDQVHHLAAVFRTAGHPDSYYHDVNVKAVAHLLAAARRYGCERIVHCSTVGVHGNIRNPPADESAPFAPADIYQRTKLQGELLVQSAIRAGQPAVVIRPAICYGEGDVRLLKLFKSIHKRMFRIIGHGQNRLHLVHAQDLARGFSQAAASQDALGQTFILAGPDAPTLEQLAAQIAQTLDVPLSKLRIPYAPVNAAAALCEALCVPLRIEPPLHRRRVSFFKHHREFDCSKAREVFSYAPSIQSSTGVARTAAWYFAQGLLQGPPPERLQHVAARAADPRPSAG